MSTSTRNDSFLEDCSPISQACVKALTDRIEQKRKLAASEIEKMSYEFSSSNNYTLIQRLIIVLGGKFCLSINPNYRKGGLLGLSSVIIGFKNGCPAGVEIPDDIIDSVVRPILTNFLDPDPRVRYCACEALYNVAKVAGSSILLLFEEIFDNMAKIVADPDSGVRGGAELLDRLLKDIITDLKDIDVGGLIKLLNKHINTENPFTRLFIISWIRLLDSKTDMITYLPDLIDEIFNCLIDTTEEIRASTLGLLSEFLNKVVGCSTDRLDIPKFMVALLKYSRSDNEYIVQYTAIIWLKQFIEFMGNQNLLDFTPDILRAILPCLAIQSTPEGSVVASNLNRTSTNSVAAATPVTLAAASSSHNFFIPPSFNRTNICQVSSTVNSSLLDHMTILLSDRENSLGSESQPLDLERILQVLVDKLEKQEQPVIQLAILEWFKRLNKAESQGSLVIKDQMRKRLYEILIETLSVRSDAVVKNALRVITDLFCHNQPGAGAQTTVCGDDSTMLQQQQANLNELTNDETQIAKEDQESAGVELEKRKSPLKTNLKETRATTGGSKKVVAINTLDDNNLANNQAISIANQLQNRPNLTRFIQSLCDLFREKESVFEDRATFIVINLCSMLKPDTIYRSFAEILKDERTELKFAYNLVQKLNQILLTTQPLFGLRSRLSSCDDDSEMTALFLTLYQAWCHSPLAALTLCLLTNNYRLANEIVLALSQADITVDILAQIDWLVQLIESPVFASLRMKLLDLNGNLYLLQSLYGLLMILPQSEAHRRLSNRLDQVYKFMSSLSNFKTLQQSQTRTSASPATTAPGSLSAASASSGKDSKRSSGINLSTAAAATTTTGSSQISVEPLIKHYNNIQQLRSKLNCQLLE